MSYVGSSDVDRHDPGPETSSLRGFPSPRDPSPPSETGWYWNPFRDGMNLGQRNTHVIWPPRYTGKGDSLNHPEEDDRPTPHRPGVPGRPGYGPTIYTETVTYSSFYLVPSVDVGGWVRVLSRSPLTDLLSASPNPTRRPDGTGTQ